MVRTNGGVYVWDRTVPGGACGVSDREPGSLHALAEALRAAPVGAEGIVRGAALPVGLRHDYAYTEAIVKGRHANGTVVCRSVRDVHCCSCSTPSRPHVTRRARRTRH